MKKASHETDRATIVQFQQIVNIGPAMASDFRRLGIVKPIELAGADPWRLYQRLCRMDGSMHDPCVLDVFIAAVDYMQGNQPKAWWKYTSSRKQDYHAKIEALGLAIQPLRGTKR